MIQGIADYVFLKSLGSGNNGDFYLARRPPRLPVDVEFVAVKVMAGDSTGVVFRRAIRELTLFAAVRSPYLLAPYDAGQQEGVFYYAMEYLPEGSLTPQTEPERAIRAIADAARAVSALHAAGIVHRDIKPANILLHGEGGRLSDLGLAHIFAEGMTITGMGDISTVQFVDPAQLLGERPGPGDDVWSLAATLHYQLTGTGFYGELSGRDGLWVLRHVLATPPKLDPRLADPIAALITRCLSPDRPTAAEFAAVLDAR